MTIPNPARRVHGAGSESIGLVWINCPNSVYAAGLAASLQTKASVHIGPNPPAEKGPSVIILGVEDVKDFSESIETIQKANPSAPVLVFGLYPDPQVAYSAIRAGARGFVHSAMNPAQLVRAIEVTQDGKLAVPRKLLEHLAFSDPVENYDALSARQREILKLLGEGLSNAQIGERLFLAESTVKQHLRSAYKVLGVHSRIQAAKFGRNGSR